MFFYLVHVPVIHAIALGLSLARYGDATWLLTSPFNRPALMAPPAGWGFGLPGVSLWTIAVLACSIGRAGGMGISNPGRARAC